MSYRRQHRDARPAVARHLPAPRPLALMLHLMCAGGAAAVLGWTPAALAQGAVTAPAARSYDIPAGPLASVLTRLSRESGVFLVGAGSNVEGKTSPGLKGSHTVEGAFSAVLVGTDLEAHRQGDGSYVLRLLGASTPVTLPTLVVTSEKIDRTFLETTSSVGYLDGEQLEEAGIRNFSDAFRLLGNVRDADGVDRGFLIRGINSEGMGAQLSPLATVNVDGVAQTQQGARRGATGLWDVEKVEVLRGPQSTISGKNALAGTVNIKTFDPSFEQEGAVRLLAGSHNQRGVAAMVSGPLTDQLAYRLTAESNKADSFVDYPGLTGPRVREHETDEQRTIRGKLLWQSRPVDGVRVLLSHSDSKDSPSDSSVIGPNYFDRVWMDASSPEARETKARQTSLEVTVPLGSDWKLTSLSSLVKTDTDRSSVDDTYTVGGFTQEDKTQELRLNYANGPWKAVAGLYLSRFDNDATADFDLSSSFGTMFLTSGRSEIDNKAVFGEVNYQMGPVTWIAGGRSEHLKQRYQSRFSAALLSSTQSSDRSSRSSAFLPKLGAQWQLAEQQRLGLVWQRGYRAGGLGSAIDDLLAFNPVPYPYDYDSEKADNTELSYRFISADKRWSVGVNAFYMDWTNQQVEVLVDSPSPFSGIVTNAAKSRVKGAELEVAGVINRQWSVFGAVGYASTRFKQFVAEGNDLSGSAFPQAPRWNVVLGASWKQGRWFAGGDLKYTAHTLSTSILTGGAAERLPSYRVLNLRAGYNWGASRLTVLLDNVTDAEYFLFRNTAQSRATVGQPRTVSLVYDHRF